MADSATGIQVARPTIAIGGQDKPALAVGLLGLTVHETVAGLYRCEALFGNWGNKDGHVDFLYFGRDLLDFGNDAGRLQTIDLRRAQRSRRPSPQTVQSHRGGRTILFD